MTTCQKMFHTSVSHVALKKSQVSMTLTCLGQQTVQTLVLPTGEGKRTKPMMSQI